MDWDIVKVVAAIVGAIALCAFIVMPATPLRSAAAGYGERSASL